MVTTEVVLFPKKPGFDPSDPNNQAAPVAKYVKETMAAVPGVQGLYSGTPIEDPSTYVFVAIWDKAESHYTFQATPEYGPFCERMFTIFDTSRKTTGLHIDFHGDIFKTFSAPVTEIATFYFDAGPPEDYYEGAEKCLEVWSKETEGLLSWAIGTTYEDMEEEGVKGKAVIMCLGWQSKEHHLKFNETETCKTHGKALASTSKTFKAQHVSFTKEWEPQNARHFRGVAGALAHVACPYGEA